MNVKNLFDKVYYPSAVSQFFVAMGGTRGRGSLSADGEVEDGRAAETHQVADFRGLRLRWLPRALWHGGKAAMRDHALQTIEANLREPVIAAIQASQLRQGSSCLCRREPRLKRPKSEGDGSPPEVLMTIGCGQDHPNSLITG